MVSHLSDEQLLKHLARVAHERFHLTVWQWKPGPCGTHATDSLHYLTYPGTDVGRAFDAYGSFLQMARFARWVRKAHRGRMTEVIYNGRFTNVSIKRGANVAASFWGAATWAEHNNHVHIGI